MERLITLKESTHITGSVLAELFDNVFKQYNIEWKKYLVGQSYDGAVNIMVYRQKSLKKIHMRCIFGVQRIGLT